MSTANKKKISVELNLYRLEALGGRETNKIEPTPSGMSSSLIISFPFEISEVSRRDSKRIASNYFIEENRENMFLNCF